MSEDNPLFSKPTANKFKSRLSFVRRPWFILTASALLLLIILSLSINDIMRAVLHSRPEVVVPDIQRAGLLDALGDVSELGLALIQDGSEFDESLPAGTIVRQHPPAGLRVRAGRSIRVVVSKGGQVVFVPDIVGVALAEAQSRLAFEGMQLGVVSEIFSPDHADGRVASQFPSSGTVVTRGALVDIAVSKGQPPAGSALLPDFVGRSVESVRTWAEQEKVRVSITENPKAAGSAGTVVEQVPAPSQPVVDGVIRVTIVPILASESGFRFSFRVPDERGVTEVRVRARGSRGEYDVYQGTHRGGQTVEIPMEVESTTRVRIYLDEELFDERVVQP